jgi:hypothetical protein
MKQREHALQADSIKWCHAKHTCGVFVNRINHTPLYVNHYFHLSKHFGNFLHVISQCLDVLMIFFHLF